MAIERLTIDERMLPRRRKFVYAYCTNGGNATQAAIYAGYSEHTARFSASRLLTDANVRAQIQAYTSRMFEQAAMSAQEVIASISNIARSDSGEFVDSTGNPLPVHLLSIEARKRVKKIKFTKTTTGTGDKREVEETCEYEVEPRTPALVALMRMHRLVDGEDPRTKPINDQGNIPLGTDGKPDLIEAARRICYVLASAQAKTIDSRTVENS